MNKILFTLYVSRFGVNEAYVTYQEGTLFVVRDEKGRYLYCCNLILFFYNSVPNSEVVFLM